VTKSQHIQTRTVSWTNRKTGWTLAWMLVETCKHVAVVAESARRLYAFVEYGAADRKLIPAAKDAQMDVRAAELHRITGLSRR
jgi:hypothetical protein